MEKSEVASSSLQNENLILFPSGCCSKSTSQIKPDCNSSDAHTLQSNHSCSPPDVCENTESCSNLLVQDAVENTSSVIISNQDDHCEAETHNTCDTDYGDTQNSLPCSGATPGQTGDIALHEQEQLNQIMEFISDKSNNLTDETSPENVLLHCETSCQSDVLSFHPDRPMTSLWCSSASSVSETNHTGEQSNFIQKISVYSSFVELPKAENEFGANENPSSFSNAMINHKECVVESESELSSSVLSEDDTVEDAFTCQTKLDEIMASVEESSLDSGIASLDEPDQRSTATSPISESESFSKSIDCQREKEKALTTRKRTHTEAFKSCLSDKVKRNKTNGSRPVSFKGVTIYYFPRKQSFVTVPSQGGSTLGMSLQHSHFKQLTLSQHKSTIARRRHRLIQEHKRQQQIDARLKQLKETYPTMELPQLMAMVAAPSDHSPESSSSSDESDEEEEYDEDDEEYDEDTYFMKPVPAKKRRQLLRMAGVQKIDSEEKHTNKLTRESREVCGCVCEGVCLPSHCQCALAGIPCQVDRDAFPCGCYASGCGNPAGRVEFDAERVRSHYIRTMRRIRLEETGVMLVGESPKFPQPRRSPYAYGNESSGSDLPENNHANVAASSQLCNETGNTQDWRENFQRDPNFSSVISTHSIPSVSTMRCYDDTYNQNIVSYSDVNNHQCSSNFLQPYDLSSDVFFMNTPSFKDFSSSASISDQVDYNFFSPQLTSLHMAPPSLPFNEVPNQWSDSHPYSHAASYSSPENCTPPNPTTYSLPAHETSSHAYKPTCKLDPIASILPVSTASGGRFSHDLDNRSPELVPLEIVGRPLDVIETVPGGNEMFSMEYLLHSSESSPNRSRSSSLSECSHDSTVKA